MARRRTAHAEARTIDVTEEALTVEARLYGAELHEDTTVRLRLRGSDTVRDLRPGSTTTAETSPSPQAPRA